MYGRIDFEGIGNVGDTVAEVDRLEAADQVVRTIYKRGAYLLVLQRAHHLHQRVDARLVDEGHAAQVQYQSFRYAMRVAVGKLKRINKPTIITTTTTNETHFGSNDLIVAIIFSLKVSAFK